MSLHLRAPVRGCVAAGPSCRAGGCQSNASAWQRGRGGHHLRTVWPELADGTSKSVRQAVAARKASIRTRASKTDDGSVQSVEAPARGGSCRDPDLWFVLEIASDEELQELSDVLYGRSLLSPIMKSVAFGDGTDSLLPVPRRSSPSAGTSGDSDSSSGSESEVPWAGTVPPPNSPLAEREAFLSRLEARFFFLSADARGTLSGARPTYREVLQSVRERLGVDCSPFLATPDLEAEIFLHLCNNYGTSDDEEASERTRSMESAASKERSSSVGSKLRKVLNEGGLDALRRVADRSLNRILEEIPSSGAQGAASSAFPGREPLKSLRSGVRAALDMSRDEILTTVLKAAKKLGMKVMQESVKYQVASRIVEQGSKVVAKQVESRIAMYAAQKSATALASRYLGLRAAMSFLGPVLWGAFFADIVLQSLGTDYARIVRAIYTIAQIRLTRTYGWTRGVELKDN